MPWMSGDSVFYCYIHYVLKKCATKLMVVISSNLNPFSKFYHHWKDKEISNKSTYYFLPHLTYVATLPMGIQKFKFVIKLPRKIKTRIIFVNKWKFHSYSWMDIVIITVIAQIVQRLLDTCKDAHTTHQLHCQWRSGPFHVKCTANAVIIFYDF